MPQKKPQHLHLLRGMFLLARDRGFYRVGLKSQTTRQQKHTS